MAIAWLSGFGDEIDSSLDVQMEVMDSLGIHAIELRGVDGKNIAEYTAKEAREIRKRMADRGFTASALGSPIGKSDIEAPFAPCLDTFKRLLDVANELETSGIRLFSFFIPKGMHARYRDEVMSRMFALKSAAWDRGVVLLHENEGAIYGDTPERCVDLARTLCDERFALIYDPSNFVQGGENALECWHAVKPYVRYFHMKDSFAPAPGTDAHGENPHCVVGDGDGHLLEVLSDVAETGFTGFFSLEPHLGDTSRYVPGTKVEKWRTAANGLKALLGECGIDIREPGEE